MRSLSGDAAAGHVARVADYYDANTRRFLRLGENSGGGAIHRGVWMPDTVSATEAADVVNRLVVERLRDHVPGGGRVLDLGCGVGATIVHLAGEIDAQISGVTISRVQADLATKRFAADDWGSAATSCAPTSPSCLPSRTTTAWSVSNPWCTRRRWLS